MTALNSNYIYLLQEREFTKTKESIYKIGKTTQPNITRLAQYPRGSILLLQLICIDCNITEKNIITAFKQKYIHCKDIGYEYFEGDYIDMIQSIFNIVTLTNNMFTCSLVEPVVDIPIIEVKPNNVEISKPILESIKDDNNYCCNVCKYKTNVNQYYKKHIQTEKHKMNIESPREYYECACIKCNKVFLSRTSLWRHKNICNIK